MDWKKLFDAAGLDPSRWTESNSHDTPPYAFDERKAWTGTFAQAPNMPMRIEAASWKGRPVSFELFGPWRRPAGIQRPAWFLFAGISIAVVGALWLAVRNFRAGRGDTRGAVRLAAAGLIFQSVSEILRFHHVPTLAEPIHVLYQIGIGLFVAAIVWVLYMALEPYLRRHWPQSLISWTRLLVGDARDPLVGGHILVGTALGVGFTLLGDLRSLVAWQNSGVLFLGGYTIQVLDAAGLIGWLLWNMIGPAGLALAIYFLFFLFRLVLRNTWAAAAVYVTLFSGLSLAGSNPVPAAVSTVVLLSSGLWVMIRFGILPFTLVLMLQIVGIQAPLTSDLSAWYVSKGLIVVALILALAVWSFRNALGGREVLRGDFAW